MLVELPFSVARATDIIILVETTRLASFFCLPARREILVDLFLSLVKGILMMVIDNACNSHRLAIEINSVKRGVPDTN